MRAQGIVRAVARDGTTVIDELRRQAPLGIFTAPGPAPGWARVWLVGSAGGPLGGDQVELAIEVGAGAALAVGSVAASLALPGAGPSRVRVRATIEPGASLSWAPEPLVVTAGADHRVDVELEVACSARLWWRDEVVLGRAGERPGRCALRQWADVGGAPWVRNELAIGGPGWDGGAVVGGHRAVGSVLTTDALRPTRAAAHLRPAAGGTYVVGLAGDRPALDDLLPRPEFPAEERSLHAAARVNA